MESEPDPRIERLREAARVAAEDGPELKKARCDLVELLLPHIDQVTARTFGEFCPDEDTSGEHPAIFQAFLRCKLERARFLRRLAEHPNPIALVRATVRNLTIDYLRRRPSTPLPIGGKRRRDKANRPPGQLPDGEAPSPEHVMLHEETQAIDFTTLDEVIEQHTVEERVLVKAVVAGPEGWSDEEVRHVAACRGIPPENVLREIAERLAQFDKRRRAFLQTLAARRTRVWRLQQQLNRARNIAKECGDEALRGPIVDAALTNEQIARFRESAEELRRATPAQRRAYQIHIENKLADAARSHDELLAKERADGLQGGPRWQEVAILTGRVAADAPPEEIRRAANTTQQSYRRLVAKIAEEMEELRGDAGR